MADPKKARFTPFRLIVGGSILLVLAIAYSLLLTGKLRALEVMSGSMEPTMMVGDRLFMWHLGSDPVHRDEIVIIDSPDDDGPELVKRIVGMPGDEVEMRQGRLFLNGNVLKRADGNVGFYRDIADFQLTVSERHYFMLGDNLGQSHDSTAFGPVPHHLIRGKVLYRYAPSDRRGKVE